MCGCFQNSYFAKEMILYSTHVIRAKVVLPFHLRKRSIAAWADHHCTTCWRFVLCWSKALNLIHHTHEEGFETKRSFHLDHLDIVLMFREGRLDRITETLEVVHRVGRLRMFAMTAMDVRLYSSKVCIFK